MITRALVVRQLQGLGERLVVLQRAATAVGPHDAQQAAVLQAAGGLLDRLLVQVHHRIAAAGLVAGTAQAAEGERVGRRHGHLLLQQAAQDALLDGVEIHAADPNHNSLTRGAASLSRGKIATDLFLGVETVKTHVRNLLAKLGVRDRVQAVILAYESGFIR